LDRFLINSLIKTQYFDLVGNDREADNIILEIRIAYENKYDHPGSIAYFGILSSNLWVEVKLKKWENSQLTYEKIEELLENKHRNSAYYVYYLMTKIRFLELSKKHKSNFEDKCIGSVSSVIHKINGLTTEAYLDKEIQETLKEAEIICIEKFGKKSKEWFQVTEYKISRLIQSQEYDLAKNKFNEIDSLNKATKNKLIKVKLDQLSFILAFYLKQDITVYSSFSKVEAFYTEYLDKSINSLTNEEKVELVTLNDKWQKISEYILSQMKTEESIQLLANSVLLNKGLSLRASLSNKYASVNGDWHTVQNVLKADQVAIQILRIEDPILKQVKPYYVALVYMNNGDYRRPKLVELGYESALTSLMSEKATLKTFDQVYNAKLRHCLDALSPYISGKYKRVYLNTSGIYNSISFAALNPSVNIQFIEVLDFNDINNQDSLSFENPRILAYGGLEYSNTSNDTSISQNRVSDLYLKYTLNEVNSIEKTFKNNGQVKVFTECKGTEKSFRKEIRNDFEIVHLATHGYYDNLNHQSSYIKQMHNCGVLFAPGAKNISEDNGNLTAYDISKMNLSQTKLVVLSACNTGLGNESAYEGVLGFQRAFKMAEVTYVVSSLWPIPDKGTATFMKYFYEQLGENKEVLQAFHLSQQKMKNEGYSPYNWGGFVISK